jgi:dienelactone hydrolase
VLLGSVCSTLAQRLEPPQAPTPVQFNEWVRTGENDLSEFYRGTFPSPLESVAPENNTVTVLPVLPKGRTGPVPVVVVLHYWGALNHSIELQIAEDLNKRGVAAVLVTLPYHLERTPAGKRSGELAIQPDAGYLRDTMTQSLQDVRRAIDLIYTRPEFDTSRIGIAGTSLGAIVAELVYAVDSRLTHGAFVLGGADIAHILWNSSRVIPQRDALRRKGYTEPKLREELVAVEPLSYLPRANPGKTFVVGALYDSVVPPASTDKLIKALGTEDTLWLETGHYGGFFVQRKLLEETAKFFGDEFFGKDYVPPQRLAAPTLRLTVQYNLRTGMDIGAGIDLWSTGARREWAATGIVTPRGLRLFFGRRVDKSLSAGMSLDHDGGSFGMMWSAVL